MDNFVRRNVLVRTPFQMICRRVRPMICTGKVFWPFIKFIYSVYKNEPIFKSIESTNINKRKSLEREDKNYSFKNKQTYSLISSSSR